MSIRKDQVFAANGFSNEYWGWGKEDDDFFFRLLLAGCCVTTSWKARSAICRIRAAQGAPLAPPHVRHNRQRRSLLLRGLADPAEDGLNTLRYQVVEHGEHADYEKIRVRW